MKLPLFGRRPPAGPPAAAPPDLRVYAVGDVHGRLDLLDDLLARIRADGAARGPMPTRLVLLGDLIDRGPDSAGVVERLRSGPEGFDDVDVLQGNHEEMLIALLAEPEPERLLHYLRVGGYQTLESYGAPERMLELPELHPVDALLRFVPDRHRAWLAGLGDQVRLGDYLFVHAGIRPGVALDEQQPADLRWIRAPFLRSAADHGAVVVHGHTVVRAAEFHPNRIAIDTGAYATGVLTALGLQGTERWLLATDGAR